MADEVLEVVCFEEVVFALELEVVAFFEEELEDAMVVETAVTGILVVKVEVITVLLMAVVSR